MLVDEFLKKKGYTETDTFSYGMVVRLMDEFNKPNIELLNEVKDELSEGCEDYIGCLQPLREKIIDTLGQS